MEIIPINVDNIMHKRPNQIRGRFIYYLSFIAVCYP
jgi:hypothetical protein